MSMTPGTRKDASSEMNVTPLIDVLLVLLIIFMVLPHNLGEKVEIPQPSPEIAPSNPQSAVVIQLHDAGSSNPPALTINEEKVVADGLEKRLREIFQIRKEKVAFVKGDPEIDFQYVAEVVDVAHHAGVDRVGLMGTKE